MEQLEDNKTYFLQSIEQTFQSLSSSKSGLTSQEVIQRRERFGWNQIEKTKSKTILDIFIDQFRNILIWILILAAIVSSINGEITEAILIIIIIVLNSVFGVYQEWKADKAIEALKSMTEFECKVIRDNELHLIASKDLVPGDIISIEQGDRIPADGRLFETNNLKVEEAALTGESQEVTKNENENYEKSVVLGEQKNMLFMGTFAKAGQGKAVVTHTGMRTEMGKIAQSVQEIEEEKTPFQIKLEEFGKNLGYGILILSAIIILVGIFIDGEEPLLMIEIGVSLAVAAIPEGLPIVITLVLALGVTVMAKKNAIIKKLPVVESLGSTTVIATDKTGTLTKNEMTVVEISVFNDNGDSIDYDVNDIDLGGDNRLKQLFYSAVLCNNSRVSEEGEVGDPTETALIKVANTNQIDVEKLNNSHPRIDEIPFDSARKRMNVLVEGSQKNLAYLKGAPEILLDLINKVYVEDGVVELTPNMKQKIIEKIENMAEKALRVLAFAYLETEEKDLEKVENQMIFIGFMGMIDPPKDGVKEAILACKTAGIRVVMVTGDHKITATAIANQVGLDIDTVITGQEFDNLSDAVLQDKVQKIDVYARISPAHKLRIVKALKDNNEIVAMTGDGVNDAPALKGADIGIAMGIQGTDVTKETADMILSDDNFASIVGAVEEGRGIYQNMTRFIRYMLSSNLAEILVVFLAIIFNWHPPLLAIQILWINLITDGLPALAMSREPKEKDIMLKPPQDPQEPLLNQSNNFYILRIAFYITFVSLLLYWQADFDQNYEVALTIAFTTLAISQLFNSFNIRHEDKSILSRSFFENTTLLVIVAISIFIQIFLVEGDLWVQSLVGDSYGTPINSAFHTVPLSLRNWSLIFIASLGTIVYEELFKLANRKYDLDNKIPNLTIQL